MKIGILIVSRNRFKSLSTTIDSALSQNGIDSILVIDDCSDDLKGFHQLAVKYESQISLIRNQSNLGLIESRNLGTRLLDCDIVLNIDDDAVFSDFDYSSVLRDKFSDRRVGALALPSIDNDDKVYNSVPENNKNYRSSQYRGTAHAIRKGTFQQLGGYNTVLFRQHEELEFSIKLFAKDLLVATAVCPPIRHYPSLIRDPKMINMLDYRNKVAIYYNYYCEPFKALAIIIVLGKFLMKSKSVKEALELFKNGIVCAKEMNGTIRLNAKKNIAFLILRKMGKCSYKVNQFPE